MIFLPKDYPSDIGVKGATLLFGDRMGLALNRTIRSAATIIKSIETAR